MATVIQIVNRVLENLDEQALASLPEATTGMGKRALDWLNETMADIYTRNINWTWRENTSNFVTVDGTDKYNFPSGADEFSIRLVKEQDTGRNLRYLDYEEWFREFAPLINDNNTGAVDTGRPSRYTIHNQQFILWPTPDAVFTINVYFFDTFTDYDTTQGASVPLIPANYHWIIRRGATWLGKDFLGDEDTPAELRKYEAGVSQMLKQDRRFGDRAKFARPELFRYRGDMLD